MELSNLNKVLFIRLSSLGDIILTTPLIRSLKTQYPHFSIDFLLREEFEEVLKFNTHIENLITVNRDYNVREINHQLTSKRYDLVIDLQNNLRSRQISKKVCPQIVRFKKPNIDKFLLVNFKINRLKNIIPIPERYSQTITELKLDNNGLELFIDPNVESDFEVNKPTIAFCPGAKHKTKRWPEEYFVELGKKLISKNFQVILLGGKEDKPVCSRINKALPQLINLSNDNKLFKTAKNMQNCRAVICNDSGLMHTALAVNVPVVTIFGSTVKEFGFAPYKGKSLVLENNSLSCRPCSHIGRDKCPKKHFNCMLEIKPDYVYQKTVEFVNSL